MHTSSNKKDKKWREVWFLTRNTSYCMEISVFPNSFINSTYSQQNPSQISLGLKYYSQVHLEGKGEDNKEEILKYL